MTTLYDVAVIGGGPGGYTTGLYCARAGFSTVVVERLGPGGQMATTGRVDNYPGFPDGVDGFDLGQSMRAAAHRFGAETLSAEATALHLDQCPKVIETTAGAVRAHCVVLAMGAYPRELGLDQERALRGRGVSYCATCDAMFYRGKEVAVVGGGNSAAHEALHLARVCRQVTLIHRRDTLAASQTLRDDLERAGVAFVWNSVAVGLEEENGLLSGVEVEDVTTKTRRVLPCQGLFVAIGRAPDTALCQGQVALDDKGYVLAGEDVKTSLPGVFAVGDLRQKPLRQIITAAADGAVASLAVEEYLLHLVRQEVRRQLKG